MTAYSYAPRYDAHYARRRSPFRDVLTQGGFALASMALVVVGGASLLGPRHDLKIVVEGAPGREPAPAPITTPVRTASDAASLRELLFSARAPFLFGQSAPLRSNFQPVAPPAIQAASAEPEVFGPPIPPEPQIAQSAPAEVAEDIAPFPVPRPPELRPAPKDRRLAARPAPQADAPPSAPTDARGIFERLCGSSQPSGPALAYANPQDGLGRTQTVVPSRNVPSDNATAVYDISARTVYMPDGTRLEAHSGLGPMMDKPEHVHVRMRGATPPAVYDLTLREKLFHGVQAIRLTPINSSIHGRSGILAHTYMLGPNGDSNGCVSFRNYDAFLQSFLKGNVKRLAVVASRNS